MTVLKRATYLFVALVLSAAPVIASTPSAQAAAAPATASDSISAEMPSTAGAQHLAFPASTPSGLARAGNIQVTLVTARTADKSLVDVNAIDINAAKNSISAASDYWRSMTNGRISLSVGQVIAGFKTRARSDQGFDTILETVTSELGWTPGPNKYLAVFIPRADVIVYGIGGYYGAGWSAGPTTGRILMPYTNRTTNTVLTHEVGHTLGVEHSNSLECSDGASDSQFYSNGKFADSACSSREYGNTNSVMGATQFPRPVIDSYMWDYGSFGRGNEILDAGTPNASGQSYTLKPWAGSDPNRAVKFRDPGSGVEYYLELRMPVGYDSDKSINGNRGVNIVRADTDPAASLQLIPNTRPFPGWYNGNMAWQAGQTFTTFAGTRVTIDSIDCCSARVTISQSAIVQSFRTAASSHPSLGAATSSVNTGLRGGGAYQSFQNGALYWSPASGIHMLFGGIYGDWAAQGGENGGLGYPTTDEIGGLRGGGVYQSFQGGVIVWSPTSGAHATVGAIRGKWAETGFENGALGYPISDEVGGLKNGGVYQTYQGGAIIWSPATGAHVSMGGIRSAWAAQGYENGPLGYPTTEEFDAGNGSRGQNYTGGTIIWTATGGAKAVSGPIGAKYSALGGPKSTLGVPVSGQVCGLKAGGCSQQFQSGVIMWSPSTGAAISVGAMRALWLGVGAEKSLMGYPVSDVVSGLKGGGSSQLYQGGAIMTSTAGTFLTFGAIRGAWGAQGFENGPLGYPTSNEYVKGGVTFQDFQGGKISWSPARGATRLP